MSAEFVTVKKRETAYRLKVTVMLRYRRKSTAIIELPYPSNSASSTLIPPRKYRQYWIPPRKYRQYWIPPKRHRQYWIPPKRYRQHWIPPKRHRLFFLVFMFSSATPRSWLLFISSGYMCTVIILRMYYICCLHIKYSVYIIPGSILYMQIAGSRVSFSDEPIRVGVWTCGQRAPTHTPATPTHTLTCPRHA